MISILCLLILFTCSLFSAQNGVEVCSNGVFKCVSATSLRICFHGQLVSSEFVCPNSTYCSEYSKTICIDFSDYDYADYFETNEEKFKPEINPDLKCTQVGLFPIPNTRCQNYYKCIKKGTGFHIKQLSCYTGYFDPVSQTCSNNYICPEDCPLEIPQCTTAGKLPIPNTGCKKYALCKKTQSGWESQVKNCFIGGFFNPTVGRCDKFYICTETTTPDSCTTTSDITPTITDSTSIKNSTTTDSPITTITASKPPITETPITNSTDDLSTNSTTITDLPITTTTRSKPPITEPPITKPPITNFTDDVSSDSTITDSPITTIIASKPPITKPSITKPPITNFTDDVSSDSTTITDTPITTITENKPPITQPPITKPPITNFTDDVSSYSTTITDTPITTITANKPPITKPPITKPPITNFTDDVSSDSTTITDTPITTITENKPPITQPPITKPPITNFTDDVSSDSTTITDTPITTITENKPPITKPPITKPPITKPPITNFTDDVSSDFTIITDTPITNITANTPSITNSTENVSTVTNSTSITDSPITNATDNKPPITDAPSTNSTDDISTVTNSTNTDSPITNATENKPPITEAPVTKSTTIINSPITNATTTEPPTTISVPSTTECTQSGRYPLPNSECKQYVLCIVTSQGFLQQILDCPLNAFFDPVTQRCKTYYICTEKATTTTQLSTIITTQMYSSTDFEEFNTTEEPSTPTQELISTDISVHGNCLEEGDFPIANTDCAKFVHCIVTSNGFLEQIFECPVGTGFDSTFKKCSENYICIENIENVTVKNDDADYNGEKTTLSTPTHEFISTEISVHGNCLEEGDFPIANTNCAKFVHCIVTSNGFLEQIFECPVGTGFDSTFKKCSENYICIENIENVTEINDEADCHEEKTTPECLEEGRFPILGISCKKYILCVKTSTGIKGKEYECPNETYFDPEKRRCLVSYQCTEKLCQTTPNFEVTTELISTTSEAPTCLVQGRIEISGTKCKKFLLCVETKQGFVSSVYSCPAGSFFHPIKKRCSESYDCQEEIKTCSTLGRFPDLTDLSCKFYYKCTEQKEINYIQGTRKECKSGYYFDPEIQQCSANYICPPNVLRIAINQNVISPRFLVNGQCTTVGRYLIQLSNCKNYVYCSANTDGTLRATNFTCPTTTVFNQAIQKCTSTASYTCPDSFCINNPGLIAWANPNAKDCITYITCQMVLDNFGMIIGYSGVINYCPQGMRFNPMIQSCDPMYVCPTNVNGK